MTLICTHQGRSPYKDRKRKIGVQDTRDTISIRLSLFLNTSFNGSRGNSNAKNYERRLGIRVHIPKYMTFSNKTLCKSFYTKSKNVDGIIKH